MKKLIRVTVLMVIVATISTCSTFGTVSKSFYYPKPDIWSAMMKVVDKNYGGIKKINPNPPTMVSSLTIKDRKFGIDKTAYQAFAGLTGFNRPYVVDIEVRAYASGEENSSYTIDRERAQEIIDQIETLLEHRKYNASLQDEFEPY